MPASPPVRRVARYARVGWWLGLCCPERGQRRKAGQPHEAPVGTLGQDISDGVDALPPGERRAVESEKTGKAALRLDWRRIIHPKPAGDIRRPRLHRIGRVKVHQTVSGSFLRVPPVRRPHSLPAVAAKCTARSPKSPQEKEMAVTGTVVCALELLGQSWSRDPRGPDSNARQFSSLGYAPVPASLGSLPGRHCRAIGSTKRW
jgi:hypothetical protein